MEVQISLDLDRTIIERYDGISEKLESTIPFVLAHKNIIEYIRGTNPQIIYSSHYITRAIMRFKQIISIIKNCCDTQETVELPKKLYVLAYMHPDTYIVSSDKPKIPFVPKYIGYINSVEAVVCRVKRDAYITILKKLVKNVVVKP